MAEFPFTDVEVSGHNIKDLWIFSIYCAWIT